jgi:hypothetical protein
VRKELWKKSEERMSCTLDKLLIIYIILYSQTSLFKKDSYL